VHITIAMALELTLTFLLGITLLYCIILERRLAAVRRGQDGLRKMIGELNGAIAGAGASLRALKAAAGEAAETLDDRLKRARAVADELSVLSTSGERIAERFDRAVPSTPKSTSNLPSGSVMHRLNALKAVR
jgi:ABC-type transporter Mla subunit MlaD